MAIRQPRKSSVAQCLKGILPKMVLKSTSKLILLIIVIFKKYPEYTKKTYAPLFALIVFFCFLENGSSLSLTKQILIGFKVQ